MENIVDVLSVLPRNRTTVMIRADVTELKCNWILMLLGNLHDRFYYKYGLPYEVVLFHLTHYGYIVSVSFNVTQK